MTTGDTSDWEERNGEYLAASLRWLRSLLDGDDGYAAAATRAAAGEGSPAPALSLLGKLLGLSQFELDTLLLAVAPELDPSIADRYASVQGAASPTFGLALRLLPNPAWHVLSPGGALRYWRLVEVDRRAGTPLVGSPLIADEHIVNYLKGLEHLDHRLEAHVRVLPPRRDDELSAGQREASATLLTHWRSAQSTGAGDVAEVRGATSDVRLVVAHAASTSGFTAYRCGIDTLRAAGEPEAFIRLWRREARLFPLALCVEADSADPDAASRVAAFAQRCDVPTVLASRDGTRAETALTVTAPAPDGLDRRDAWRARLTDAALADELAEQFILDLPTIAELAAGPETGLRAACRARTRPRLEDLAQRIEPRARWNDLVVPQEADVQLRALTAQVKHRTTVYQDWGFAEKTNRGLAITALFAGPSGTGKTLAAEVIAAELELDLYRVDLSTVVSKYIGETEKQLRLVFDEIERAGAVLLFDEADSLFGKRSEVRDSHDRYANLEVSYLLQRMEAYRGLAILATNLRQSLDHAFLRRLRFVVTFPFPETEQRREMWQRAFPPDAPIDALDHDRLAALPASGGMIRNIALGAAFRAAELGVPVTMPLVLAAARDEFQKQQIPIRERDFKDVNAKAVAQ